jgi:outer membrane protein
MDVKLSTTTALAALLLAPAAFAQGQPAAAAPTKLGVLNMTGAIFNTAEGKQGIAEMQSKFAPLQTELQNLQKQIQDAQRRLGEGQSTLSDEDKARLQGQIEIWTRSGQRKQQELEDLITYERNDLGGRILKKMDAVIERYAQENGFAVIIDVSSQQVPYWSNTAEVTQDIIRAYDSANPVGAAAQQPPRTTPAQPGQPRPKPPGQR